MFSSKALVAETIAEFHHDGMMRYSSFVPRLYNLCRSLGFTPGKIMPSRAFCSDENQGYPIILIAKHFGAFPFNHGMVGGVVATNRHAPHSHHGKDLVIIHASHVGYDPVSQTFGSYRRIQTENNDSSPTCGNICAVVDWYTEEYRFACDNIYLRGDGADYQIAIDNQLLNERRQEGLFLNLERFLAHSATGIYDIVRTHSTAKSYRLTEAAIERLGREHFTAGKGQRIGARLPADWFEYRRELPDLIEGQQHMDRNLLRVMPQIVTSPAPALTAAQVNTQVEYDRAFRTIAKSHAYQAQKILLISGLNIDVSPAPDQMFPLTKFLPWASFYKDEAGTTQSWEQAELVELLRAQSAENPYQIDLEAAIAAMGEMQEVKVHWPT